MGMSQQMQYVHNKALKLDWKLTTNLFNNACSIVHDDGSMMFFQNAFLAHDGEYLICFTEHLGFHIFHKDDLLSWREFNYTKDNIIELDHLISKYT